MNRNLAELGALVMLLGGLVYVFGGRGRSWSAVALVAFGGLMVWAAGA